MREDLIKEIGTKAAELNRLVAALPKGYKVEVDVADTQSMGYQFPIPHISVSIFQWKGGNRRG